jgi:hypothetical protein
MKRFRDLSKEELVTLTDEQIQNFIDIEIAYEGIMPVLEPQYLAVPAIDIKPTVAVYECHSQLFKNKEDAIKFSEMEKLESSYEYSIGSDYKYCSQKSDYGNDIKTKYFYKKEELEKVQTTLQDISRIQNRNNEQEKEYKNFIKETSKVRQSIYETINEAQDEIAEIEKAKKIYEKHLSLADGNKEIADKFFCDAYKNFPEIIEKIITA